MFITRLLSGIVLVAGAVAVILAGSLPVLAVTFAISIIGLYEYYRAVGISKTGPAVIGYLTCVCYYAILFAGRQDLTMFLVISALMAMMAVYVLTFPRYHITKIAEASVGIIYPGIMLSYLWMTRTMPDGVVLVWLIFLSSWGCDTLAYCSGLLFGKHKLAPVLSPKKTIEGAVGGTVGAALLGLIFALAMGQFIRESEGAVFACTCACGIGALISQIGDLTASGIKRNYEIKDYGTLIPGHGGVLDRFDSMVFTAPAIYFALLFLVSTGG